MEMPVSSVMPDVPPSSSRRPLPLVAVRDFSPWPSALPRVMTSLPRVMVMPPDGVGQLQGAGASESERAVVEDGPGAGAAGGAAVADLQGAGEGSDGPGVEAGNDPGAALIGVVCREHEVVSGAGEGDASRA
jgi:hypothetical protein